MKKILLVFILVAVIVFSFFLVKRIIGYSRDTDPGKTFLLPEVQVSVVNVLYLDKDSANLSISIRIENHFPFSFTADSFRYAVYITDVPLLESTYKKGLRLEGNDSSWISLPVTIHLHDFDSLLALHDKLKIDSVNYKMKASFYADIIFTKEYNVTINRFLPLIHPFTIEVERTEMDKLGLSGVRLNLFVSIKNNNVFDISFRDLAWKFSIEDYPWTEGALAGVIEISAKKKKVIMIPVKLSFLESGKTFFKLLTQGDKVDFTLYANFNINSKYKSVNDAKIFVKTSGNLKALLKNKEIKKKE